MKLDVVSNGIVYMHLFLVALMTIAGFPPIVIYISLLWGAAATWRSLFEGQFVLELPNQWNYRNMIGLGIKIVIFSNNLQFMT